MSSESLTFAAQRDLERIRDAIEQLTGLPSRWSGRFTAAPPSAEYWGVKRWSCDISVREDILQDIGRRWTTLIHESLHAVSIDLTQSAFVANRGWEEGVVEQTQRLLRGRILDSLKVTIEDARLQDIDRLNIYNNYVRELERLRGYVGAEADRFYLDLLSTPLAERAQHVRDMGAREEWTHLFEEANRVLKR